VRPLRCLAITIALAVRPVMSDDTRPRANAR